MAVRRTLVLTVEIDGLRETLARFKALPKEASVALKDRTRDLAEDLAKEAKAAGYAEGSQAALVAKTVKVSRDRVPVIQAGGTRKLGRKRTPAYGLVFASEFGMNARSGWYGWRRYRKSQARQYKPHIGAHSYWFKKTVKENQTEIARAWTRVADDVCREFGEGG